MIHFVGAGSGAADLITVRGQNLLAQADVIIYAGSLVNPELLRVKKEGCLVYNSATMTLEDVMAVMEEAEKQGLTTVRLHTGDPSLYGAIREQMDCLQKKEIPFDVCPGVSSFCGAAAAIGAEYTLPGVSQTLIISRMEGRTPVPQREAIKSLAVHQASMVLFLSTGLLDRLQGELMEGGYPPDTPAAIVYKATWPDERKVFCTVETLHETAQKYHITKTALILVGRFLEGEYERSKLYDPSFATEFRAAQETRAAEEKRADKEQT